MAVAPLFVASMSVLQQRLRLSSIDSGADAQDILEDAVAQVRVGFYMRLGTTRTAQLVALSSSDNPTTNDAILRKIAEVAEVTWVRVILMDRLPMLWMDQSGGQNEVYNQEGAFRSMDPVGLRQTLVRMREQLDDWMAFLAGEVELGDDTPNVWTSSKPDPLPILGETPFIKNPLGDGETMVPGDFDGNFIDRAIDGDDLL